MGQQLFATDSLGGYLNNDALSKELRYLAQPLQRFRQFVRTEGAAGKGRGAAVFFDKVSNISTAGGTLSETSTIPKRNFTITQGTLTLTERGNAIPFTEKVDSLSELSVTDAVKTALKNDMATVLDIAAAAEYQTSDYKANIINTATTTFGSAGVATATAGANMSDKNVRDIIDRMKTLFIPKVNGTYICIASTNSIRGLYDFFEPKAQNVTLDPLRIGEVGLYYGCKFIEETNVLVNTLGSGDLYGEAIFFGDDAVIEGIAIPEEIRIDIPKDFGRDQAIAWYALNGFAKVWDFSSDTQTRIIHVNSI